MVARLSLLPLFIAALCLGLLWRWQFTLTDGEGNVKPHEGEEGKMAESTIECNRERMVCSFTNLYWDGQRFYAVSRRDLSAWAGLIMDTGFGQGGRQFYLETWWRQGWAQRNAAWRERQLRGMRTLAEVMDLHGRRHYQPIRVIPRAPPLHKARQFIQFPQAALFYSLIWPDNIFRVAYAAHGALATLLEHAAYGQQLVQFIDKSVKAEYAPLVGVLGSEVRVGLPKTPCLFPWMLLGMSRTFALEEIRYRPAVHDAIGQTVDYRLYGKILRQHLGLPEPNFPLGNEIVLVQRRGASRRILNLAKITLWLRRAFPASQVRVVCLEARLGLREQIQTLLNCRILVAVHGAALMHAMHLAPGALVVEIHPFGFRKVIYRHYCEQLRLAYVAVPTARPEQVEFVRGLPSLALRWDQQTIKDQWREQNLRVDGRLLLQSLRTWTQHEQHRYLLYAPWEQFNNQLISFKVACGVASLLNRTLVLPPIGHLRVPIEGRRRQPYDPLDYEWEPMQRYFELRDELLPCRTVPFDAFCSVQRQVSRLFRRNLGFEQERLDKEMMDYYWRIAGLRYERTQGFSRHHPLIMMQPSEVKQVMGKGLLGSQRVLALGNIFWLYTFGQGMDYPLTRYHDLMVDPTYRAVVSALQIRPELVTWAQRLWPANGQRWLVVHWRRADYWQKCHDNGLGTPKTLSELRSCYQSVSILINRLRRLLQRGRKNLQVYLATNERGVAQLQREVEKHFGLRLYTLADLVVESSPLMNSIEWILVEQLFGSWAEVFLGNYHSSFSRTIAEMRQLDNKTSHFF